MIASERTVPEQIGAEAVIEQQEAERKNEVIQERVVGREDDADFPRRNNEEAEEAHAARQERA